jgi:hypothetical protein
MQEQQLKAAPFNLDAAAIAWVRAVFSRLSEDDKVRQLFNLRSAGDDPQMLARQQAFRAGSVTRIPGPDWAAEREIIARAKAAGWRALACDRAGVFKLVEVWVENNLLVEVLVPAEVERYGTFMNPEGCSQMFGAGIAPGPIPHGA